MNSPSFERFGGVCAILSGLVGLLYSIVFIVLQNNLLSALFLMLGGLLSTAALVAIYARLRLTDALFALWALLLGIAGALGMALHGGYDLANAINPPQAGLPALPSPVDPRGLATFGISGVAIFVVGWLIARGGQFPRGLSYLGYVLAVLLVILYLGRLLVVQATNPVIFVPALATGFLVNPAWYIWLGLDLWRKSRV